MAEVSRILNGKTFVFPDEETARRADAALEASRIARAQKEESFFDACACCLVIERSCRGK